MTINHSFFAQLAEQPWLPSQEAKTLSHRYKNDDLMLLNTLTKTHPEHLDIIGKLWGDSIGATYAPPGKTPINHILARKLSRDFATKHLVVPLYESDGVITIAAVTPTDNELTRLLETRLDQFVSMVFALPIQIEAALELAYVDQDELSGILLSGSDSSQQTVFAELGKLAQEETIIEFTKGMFLLALRNRASDIHIEPTGKSVRVRFRQDGFLQEVLHLDQQVLPRLVNHIKILAGVDIAENRKPQDGRLSVSLTDREIDVRFSCVPTIYGEKIVLRILGQNTFASLPSLGELALSKSVYDNINKVIASPNGIFFLTGPTGCGKTTTLFALLNRLSRPEINIMTIEDPVEYRLPGINQIQVDLPADVTFAKALRAFLRQDPDVVLIGEIRDLETAKIAAQAALTGHLVMATMHTNSALQAITRLIQIGVEPFLVAPSVIGVMAQRLVRRLCDNCKKPHKLMPREIKSYFQWDGQTEVTFFQSVGCEQCHGSGYYGRLAIHELFILDETTRDLIASNASILTIQQHAFEKGFQSLRYDGFKKVLRGLTTPEEVDRVAIEFD